jgi:hypothetical protein
MASTEVRCHTARCSRAERCEDSVRGLVLGASGATGREVVQQALAKRFDVTAFVRDPARLMVGGAALRVVRATWATTSSPRSHLSEKHMPDDELKPGVDKPTRWQYVIGALAIVVVSLLAYWWLGRR